MLTSWLDIVVVFFVTAIGFLAVVSVGAALAEVWHRFQGSSLTLAATGGAAVNVRAPVLVAARRLALPRAGSFAIALVAFISGCVAAGSIAAGRFNAVKTSLVEAALSSELHDQQVVALVQRLSDTADRLRREPGSPARLQEIETLVATMRQKLEQIRTADCRTKVELTTSSLVPFSDSRALETLRAKCTPG